VPGTLPEIGLGHPKRYARPVVRPAP